MHLLLTSLPGFGPNKIDICIHQTHMEMSTVVVIYFCSSKMKAIVTLH